MHHSAAFKVLGRDISEGSEDQVEDTKIIPTDQGDSSNNPNTFRSWKHSLSISFIPTGHMLLGAPRMHGQAQIWNT